MSARRPASGQPIRARGFTLIELLVVVVVIAILGSIVMLSIGVMRDDRDLDREARRMASLIELVADEAMLQGRDFGIEFLLQGYRFVEYDPLLDRWVEVVGDDLLAQRTLPEEMELDLYVEDRAIRLSRTPASTTAGEDDDGDLPGTAMTEAYAPHALIMSSGDVMPFNVIVRRPADDAEIPVEVTPAGEIRVGEEDDDNV